MTTTYADTVYTILNMSEPIRPTNIDDLKRVIREDQFDVVHEDGITHVYTPTKERQKGDNHFMFVFAQGRLLNNTTIALTGAHN